MKILGLIICASLALAQTPPPAAKPPAPREIPADRKEAISQVMLDLQHAQLTLQNLELQIRAAQDKAQADAQAARERVRKVLDAAQTKYDTLQDSLRKEFNAAECELKSDKTWQCAADQPQKTEPKK